MASGSMGSTYVLEGQESDLKKHVGHKVEVTGTTDSSASDSGNRAGASGTSGGSTTAATTSGTSSSTASGSGTTGSGSMNNMAGGTHLRVSSVRMVSADCSTK
jgi:hypothetical protein